MKRSSQSTRQRRCPTLLIFFSLSILFLTIRPDMIAEDTAAQAGWRLEVEEGKTARSAVSINNRCSQPHTFRIKDKIKYLRFERPTEAVLIGPAATEQLGVVFDSTGLKSKVYRDKLVVECLDCKKEKGCNQDRDELSVEMSVIKPASLARAVPRAGGSAGGPSVNIKILFMWSGMIGPGGGGGCNVPLGICITRGFTIAAGEMSPAEVADGFGTAAFQVEGDRLRMTFHREAALRDGTIRIERDKQLEPEVSAALGYARITLKAGAYRVDKSRTRFGEALVEIIKMKSEPGTSSTPVAIKVVTCQRYSETTGPCKGCGVSCDDGNNYPMSCGADIFNDINRCAGQRLTYDPGQLGPVEVFGGRFAFNDPAVLKQLERGRVKLYAADGVESSCTGSTGTGSNTTSSFMVVIPKLNR